MCVCVALNRLFGSFQVCMYNKVRIFWSRPSSWWTEGPHYLKLFGGGALLVNHPTDRIYIVRPESWSPLLLEFLWYFSKWFDPGVIVAVDGTIHSRRMTTIISRDFLVSLWGQFLFLPLNLNVSANTNSNELNRKSSHPPPSLKRGGVTNIKNVVIIETINGCFASFHAVPIAFVYVLMDR